MAEKRYFWLKLQSDFFNSKRIKKLRKMAGGDTYTIIYLKMQLNAIKTDGVLHWTGLEETFADELALELDEEPDNVRVCLAYLLSCGLAETNGNQDIFLPFAVQNTGSESTVAQRVRDCRSRKLLQCNTDETIGNTEIEIEIEKEIDTEIKKDSRRFTPPTPEEVRAYCSERNNAVDAERFCDYYASKGWKVGNTPMKDWKAAVRNWERKDGRKKPNYSEMEELPC